MAKDEMNDVFAGTSFLYGGNAAFIEQLYARYQENPDSVDPQWREFFSQLKDDGDQVIAEARGASWQREDWPIPLNGEMVSVLDGNWAPLEEQIRDKIDGRAKAKGAALSLEELRSATLDSIRALMMIRAYRIRGHLDADLDPLSLEEKTFHPELEPETYGFTEEDLDRPIFIDNVLGLEAGTIREMIAILRRTYCSTIGVEFMHITDPLEKAWLQERIEGPGKEISFTPQGRKAILTKLIEAEGFEKFIDVKYTGTKRFGLDGGESMVPALEQIIKRGGSLGLKDIVLGMPHRGRLNVLAQVMGKPHKAIFNEFKGGSVNPEDVEGSGDVKYHLGTSSDREFERQQRAPVADGEPVAPGDRRSGRARQGSCEAGPAQ